VPRALQSSGAAVDRPAFEIRRMKRTALPPAVVPLVLCLIGSAQEPVPDPAPQSQPAFVKELVEKMRAAEQSATSVQLELRTTGSFPGGMSFQTSGTLRVLKGAHPRLHARMEYSGADGIAGRMETLKTPDGVWILEDNPTFGGVLLVMDAALVGDLEWAASVLGRSDDVPGVDRQAAAPLGSSLVQEFAAQYELKVLSRKDRNGQPGRWIGGELRSGLQSEADPGMPLFDRIEFFVREGDAALLEVVHFQQGRPAQRVEIDKLTLNQPLDPAEFRLSAGDRKPTPVREHLPAWSQIERILAEADAKAGPGVERPSRRKAGTDDKEGKDGPGGKGG
jgi:hypothetical protein